MADITQQTAGAARSAGDFFLPSADAAQAVDKTVRDRLTSSFGWLAESYPCLNIDAATLDAWQARPTDFGLYFDLASAVHHNPDSAASEEYMARAQRLADRVTAGAPGNSGLAIKTLSSEHFDAVDVDCLLRWFDLEPENSMALLPLDAAEFKDATEVLNRALTCIERALPDFYGELTALTTEIIFAKPGPDAKLSFGGASSFALWGAMALNAQAHDHWWDYLPRIVHEYSHNFLFGLASDGELVTNDPSERFRSPLRETARPIDGIYHACYVSARETVAMDAVLAALPALGLRAETDTVGAYCTSIQQRSLSAYHDCKAVIDEHAKMTDLGQKVLSDTAAAIAAR